MTRELAAAVGIAALVWLGYMAWLAGYNAGYGDGTEQAWQRARDAIPALSDPSTSPVETVHFLVEDER